MSRLKIGLLVIACLLVAAMAGGTVGGGAAIALVGYSLGGLFTLYALTEKADLFDGFIAFSPSIWVNDQSIVPVLERWSQGSEPVSSRLFMSLGSLEGNQMRRGYEAVESALSASTPPGFRWHAEITANADHIYSPALSFPVAAMWFWDAASR